LDLEERLRRAETEMTRLQTEASRFESRLAEREASYEALFEAVPDAVLVLELETHKIVQANAAAIALFAYSLEELLQMTDRDLAPGDERQPAISFDDVLSEAGEAWVPQVRAYRKGGDPFVCDIRLKRFAAGNRDLVAVVARDVTEAIEQRKQLEQADRLAAIGRLSAGVAHEINNPSMVVLANAEASDYSLEALTTLCDLLEETASSNDALDKILQETNPREHLDDLTEGCIQIREAIQRVAAIVGDLVRFTRVDGNSAPAPSDINEVVRAAITMTAPEVRGRATLELEEGPLRRVTMRAGAIGQIIVNLISNAAQAIEEGNVNDNRITIKTGVADGGVYCTVTDTGNGIPDAHRARIFESLFTTKSAGRGTGLGLSISARIAHEHGGTLALESTGPKGSAFRLWLPDVQTEDAVEGPYTPVPIGRLRVLIIDDERDIRSSLVRLLQGSHEVVTEASGEVALERLRLDPEFDIILCDVIMPGMDGPAFFEALQSELPHLSSRVVFMTGGLPSARARAFVERRGEMVVGKPISREALHSAFARMQRRTAFRASRLAEEGAR
jgi:PAS domain S-box-containing protein